MEPKSTIKFETTFHRDVYKGLTDSPKHVSSKYFYDQRGDKLFQEIMAMPEYYLTRCETDILQRHKDVIGQYFMGNDSPFNIIELGAGDGKKTRILLRYLAEQKAAFKYQPIDISQNVLNQLQHSIALDLPMVRVETRQGTYFEILEHLCHIQQERKVLLFLGSNIGNLLHQHAIDFLKGLHRLMLEDDLLFVGFDQKKHPGKILDAYNDKQGITEAFNKNVLLRINRELGGNFDPDNFLHWEVYNPESGTAKSYLVAKRHHTVTVAALDLEVVFDRWETIHTEISQKYDDKTICWMAEQAGMEVVDQFSDTHGYYKNYIFRKA